MTVETLPVSVIIPAYNRGHVLARAIESVHRQRDVRPSEIVVADDGSIDNTSQIARYYGCLVLRSRTNRGSGPTRNRAVQAATQPWLAFLDSDDEWLPHHLSTVWQHARDRRVIGTRAVIIGERGRHIRIKGSPSNRVIDLRQPRQALIPENPIVTSSVLMHRQVFEAVEGFRPYRRAQDLDLWMRVLEQTSIRLDPTVSLRYHVGADQAILDVALMDDCVNRIVHNNQLTPAARLEVLRSYDSVKNWDAFRAGIRTRETHVAMAHLRALLDDAHTIPVLLQLLRNRRALRRHTRNYLFEPLVPPYRPPSVVDTRLPGRH